jgi:hypothetical protein
MSRLKSWRLTVGSGNRVQRNTVWAALLEARKNIVLDGAIGKSQINANSAFASPIYRGGGSRVTPLVFVTRETEGSPSNSDPSVIRQDRAVTPMRASHHATSPTSGRGGKGESRASFENTVQDAFSRDTKNTVLDGVPAQDNLEVKA